MARCGRVVDGDVVDEQGQEGKELISPAGGGVQGEEAGRNRAGLDSQRNKQMIHSSCMRR
jgi:hypothetical protein